MNEHILISYSFDGKGGGVELSGDDISHQIKDEKLAWVHMDACHPDTKKWLEKEATYLDPFIIEALIADETRPRMTQIGDGVLLILRGVNLNENAEPEDMVSIRMWIDKNRIISLRRRKLMAAQDIKDRLNNGKGPKDSGEFLSMLISRLSERMQPVLTELDTMSDDIEEKILEGVNSSLREAIIDVRKQAIIFRRYMAPQKDSIGQLLMADLSWIDESNKRHLHESYNHITRYVEDLDAIRERAQIVKDEIANIIADRLNNNMYVLSIIAAIFLPLGFLTGLLGINVGGIPGAENSNAFMVFCMILAVIVFLQIVLFKKFKWL